MVVRVHGDDRDRARMPDDVPGGPAAVAPFDRVDAERQVAAPMDDAGVDDPLEQVVDGFRRRARTVRVRVGRRGVDRTGGAGPVGLVGQAATGSRSDVRLMPLSASNR
jgi:hypothetical protein